MFLFDIISWARAGTLKLLLLSRERSQAVRPKQRGGRRAVRVYTVRSSPKRTALCGVGGGSSLAPTPEEPGQQSQGDRSPGAGWLEMVASRTPPLVVMKSTRRQVLTELPEA